jgi:hypothetical protein
MQTNRGVARRDCRCAQARTRFTPIQRFAKEKLCLSIKAFYAVRIFAGPRGGVRIAQRVGWVEPTGPARSGRPDDRLRETHHAARRPIDGFRKGSSHPTRLSHNSTFKIPHDFFVNTWIKLREIKKHKHWFEDIANIVYPCVTHLT